MANYLEPCWGGKQKRHSPVRLNASTGSAGPLPIITTLFGDPISVVDVTINTNGMSEPVVLLTFTGILNLPLGVSVTLNFEIMRSQDGGAPVSIGSTYTYADVLDILASKSFAFQYFDNNLAPGVYTYAVQLSTNSIIDITPGLTVSATLSALAVDND